jgi:hypothetical protein
MQSSFLRSLTLVTFLFQIYLPISVLSFHIPQFPTTSSPTISQRVSHAMAGAMVAWSIGTSVLCLPAAAVASDSRIIGQIAGSGLVFKDTLVVESFDDPKVRCWEKENDKKTMYAGRQAILVGKFHHDIH